MARGTGIEIDLQKADQTVIDGLRTMEESLEKALGHFATPLGGEAELARQKAQQLLQEFMSGYRAIRKDVLEHSSNITRIREDEELKANEEYKKSRMGRLQNFAEEWLKKAEEKVGNPIKAIRNNKILNDVVEVIKKSCNLIKTVVVSTLNNFIAGGELAKAIVNLGKDISEAIASLAAKFNPGAGMAK